MQHSHSNPTTFAIRPRTMLAVAIMFALAGCKSTEDKREDIVRCSGFIMGLIMSGAPVSSATEAALARDGVTGQDTLPLGEAARQYASTMEPAKVSRLAQEGSASAAALARNNDANGIADYLKSCVATYKDLGS